MTTTVTANERVVLKSQMDDENDAEGKRFGRRIFGAFDMREALKKITAPLRPPLHEVGGSGLALPREVQRLRAERMGREGEREEAGLVRGDRAGQGGLWR